MLGVCGDWKTYAADIGANNDRILHSNQPTAWFHWLSESYTEWTTDLEKLSKSADGVQLVGDLTTARS